LRFMKFRMSLTTLLTCTLGLVALAQITRPGFDRSRIDESTGACTDFYRFVQWQLAEDD
jgi:hypothetical protein